MMSIGAPNLGQYHSSWPQYKRMMWQMDSIDRSVKMPLGLNRHLLCRVAAPCLIVVQRILQAIFRQLSKLGHVAVHLVNYVINGVGLEQMASSPTVGSD